MKRWITLISCALASIAITSPLYAAKDTVTKAEKRSMNIPAKVPPAKPSTPVMRTGKVVKMARAPRLEELRRAMTATPAAGGTERTVPNILVPDRLKQKLEQRNSASSRSAAAPAPRKRSPVSGKAPTADQSINGYDSDDNAALFGFRIMPPDTQGDVGLEHYVQWNNLGFKIFLKDGTLLNGPNGDAGNIFWAGTGGTCETENDGDPIVLYDEQAARWVFTQFEISSGAGLACFAVSDGEDPAGPYTTYEFPISIAGFNDYPKMGIWTTADGSQSAYHMTTNEFGAGFLGVNLTAFDRDAILAGGPAGFQQFTIPPAGPGERFAFALQPPHLEGAVLPPAGTCATYIMAFDEETWGDATGVDGYRTWEFCADFAGGSPSLTENPFVVTSLPFDAELCGYAECVPQPNGQKLDTLGQFTMYRFAVRMLDGDLTGVISHTADLGGIPPVPADASAILIDRPGEPALGIFGCSENDINTELDDAAGTAVEDVCDVGPPAIGAGPYSPNEPLANFNGEPVAGTWRLTVTDNAGGDTGTWNEWCLISADIPGSPVCSSPSTPILDDTTSDDIVIADAGTISDLNVSFDANHTWVGDLTVTLERNPGAPGLDVAGSQWAKLDLNAAPSLSDTGVVDAGLGDGLSRWMPSVSQDAAGNMAIVYSRSGAGPTDFPSVYYAGRESGDPAGTLQAEEVCVDGSGSQVGTAARWGDYATASIDPADDCTFWVTNEFVETTGSFQWDTQICSFRFDSCNPDSDGDGVTDDIDVCPGTVIPESVPTRGTLKSNKSAMTGNAPPGEFETAGPNPQGLVFTLEDTAGCSCEQIVEAQGLGKGHLKNGCSFGAMKNWIELVNP